MRLDLSMRSTAQKYLVAGLCQSLLLARKLQIVVQHQADQLPETDLGPPTERALDLGWIAAQLIGLGRPQIARIAFDELLPVEIAQARCHIQKVAYRVRFTRGYHV